MALFALADLHLGFNCDKPMDKFGDNWKNHSDKIKENWLKKVSEEDTVLISGDISWALKPEDSRVDLEWIESLPGNKILGRGNHDYWWSSITKLNKLYPNTKFLQNNFYTYEDYAICGTRGWLTPGIEKFTAKDQKIYDREIIRLKLSLDAAKNAGYEKIIVMLHYPPVNDKFESSPITDILEEYKVEKVIYGHLHGPLLKGKLFTGMFNGIEYILTSADYLNFDPTEILK